MVGDCHKCVYGKVLKDIKLISEFSEEDKQLLNLRISFDIENICNYYEIKFLLKYNHFYGTFMVCSDPLKYHKKPANKGLREINLAHLSRLKNLVIIEYRGLKV